MAGEFRVEFFKFNTWCTMERKQSNRTDQRENSDTKEGRQQYINVTVQMGLKLSSQARRDDLAVKSTAPAKNPSSVPSTLSGKLMSSYHFSSRGPDASGLWGQVHSHAHTQTDVQTDIHTYS